MYAPIRTKDASELGVPRNYLGRLVRKGILEKVRRGLYTSPEFSGNEHLTQVMKRLGGMWFLAASLLSLVPRALRDLGYVTCAFLRKAILGTTKELWTCARWFRRNGAHVFELDPVSVLCIRCNAVFFCPQVSA